jgi:UDP-3-O-[3-hydroxymyristoyl] N-acetylglucosamine deacetylase/3-hydroxyacyl-[acyl-carrier-protein] dehydratase
MVEMQCTLAAPLQFIGVGLHTGEKVSLEICPANENQGYKFQRIDVEGSPIIPADVDYVVATDRGTTLEFKGVRVYTTEHVLAALVGCGIDNALIKLSGPEIPILDGSALPYVHAIEKTGKVEQEAERVYLELDEIIPWEDLEKNIEFLAVPNPVYRITVMVDYNSPVLGTQHASMYHLGEFNKEIAPCRTFCFLRELEFLAKNNLIKGGDLDNAIVLVDRTDISKEELDRLAQHRRHRGPEQHQVAI